MFNCDVIIIFYFVYTTTWIVCKVGGSVTGNVAETLKTPSIHLVKTDVEK